MQKPKLLRTLPPYVDQTDPRFISWRLDEQAQAIEHLQESKMDNPSASVLRLLWVGLSAILGLIGLALPEKSADILLQLLK
jgi:hypothetical protein